jgi:hypothetical protein
MGIKTGTIKTGSELYIRMNRYTTITVYILILIEFMMLILTSILSTKIITIVCVVYMIWFVLSLFCIQKMCFKNTFEILLIFPIYINTILTILIIYYIIKNKYPAQTDDDYLRNFYRKQKIKSIL